MVEFTISQGALDFALGGCIGIVVYVVGFLIYMHYRFK